MTTLLYHNFMKCKTRFGGVNFYSSGVGSPSRKATRAYVVEKLTDGKPPHLVLRGCYRINDVIDNPDTDGVFKDKKYRFELSPAMEAEQRIDDLSWFDWDVFRGGQSNGVLYGTVDVPREYDLQFDGILTSLAMAAVDDYSAEDIQQILGDGFDEETDCVRQIKSRLGQGKFRTNVIETWGGNEVCALTAIPLREVLIASHIIPWRECVGDLEYKRLDGANGLLLSASIDKLFDRYLISFERKGKRADMRVAPGIGDVELRSLGVSRHDYIEPTIKDSFQLECFFDNLEEHFKRFCALQF